MATEVISKEEFMALHYPRWIYKDGKEPRIVKDVWEHAVYFNQGWSGPPKFYSEIGELETLIQETKDRLDAMERELAVMKGADREKKEDEDSPEDAVPTAPKEDPPKEDSSKAGKAGKNGK